MRYARIKPAVCQIELHPYLTQEEMVKLCKVFDIKITGYSSFGPASFVELDMHKGTPSLFEHNVVGQVASKYNKSAYILESTVHKLTRV